MTPSAVNCSTKYTVLSHALHFCCVPANDAITPQGLSSHKNPPPKEKKKRVQSLLFLLLLLLLSLHNRRNSSSNKTGDTRRLSGSRGERRAQSRKRRTSATRKPREHDRLQAQSAIVWTPLFLIHETALVKKTTGFSPTILSIFWKIIGKLFGNLEKSNKILFFLFFWEIQKFLV
jgi:hypothetical protein